jgi:hypothetical protein
MQERMLGFRYEGLGWKTRKEWFSALDIARTRNHQKIQCKCLLISRKETMTKKLNKTQIEFAKNQLFEKKRSVAEATMYECYGIEPRRCILGS